MAKRTKEQKIVENYNKRVRRGTIKAPTLRLRDLRKVYTDPKDLNRKLKILKSFSAKNLSKKVSVTKENVFIPKHKLESYELSKKYAEEIILDKIAKSEAIDKKQGRIFAGQRTRRLRSDLKTLSLSKTYNQLMASMRTAQRYTDTRPESDQQFYLNFFEMMWSNQDKTGADYDVMVEIETELGKLTPEQLLEAYNNEPSLSRMVEDYHKYEETNGDALTDQEKIRSRIRLEMLKDELPAIIEKYSKL